jgi:translation initiation factor IF-1
LTFFDGFGLDEAIMRAIAEEKHAAPAPIRERTMPIAMSRSDEIVAMSRSDGIGIDQTGNGKRSALAAAERNKQGREMTKEELLQFEGLVMEILPDARYRVQLDAGHTVIVYTAGRMKKNRIKTLAGDRVTVEVSPYDLDKGRMIFRHKDERAGTGSRPPQRNTFRRR